MCSPSIPPRFVPWTGELVSQLWHREPWAMGALLLGCLGAPLALGLVLRSRRGAQVLGPVAAVSVCLLALPHFLTPCTDTYSLYARALARLETALLLTAFSGAVASLRARKLRVTESSLLASWTACAACGAGMVEAQLMHFRQLFLSTPPVLPAQLIRDGIWAVLLLLLVAGGLQRLRLPGLPRRAAAGALMLTLMVASAAHYGLSNMVWVLRGPYDDTYTSEQTAHASRTVVLGWDLSFPNLLATDTLAVIDVRFDSTGLGGEVTSSQTGPSEPAL